jgi:hypothetical protein
LLGVAHRLSRARPEKVPADFRFPNAKAKRHKGGVESRYVVAVRADH